MKRLTSSLGAVYTVLLALFMLFPVLAIVPASLGVDELLRFPPRGLTLRWYEQVLSDRDWLDSAWLSLRLGLGAAVLSTLLGLALCLYAYHYRNLPRGVQGLLTLPLWMPHVVLATGLFTVLLPVNLLGSEWVLVLVNASLALPIGGLLLLNAGAAIEPSLWTAATSLGATPLTALRTVILPLLSLALVSALILGFHSAWDETVFAVFVGPQLTPTLSSRIYAYLGQNVTPAIAAVATLIVAMAVIVTLVLLSLRRRVRERPHYLH